MILEQLELNNFGLYSGRQVLNLAPDPAGKKPAPVILFGGINGGGKTTLLDAIQLVLYGNRANCTKRVEKPYDSFLLESIHQGVDPSQGASIRLSFQYATNGQNQLYEVIRSWAVNGQDRLHDKVVVSRGGEIDKWLSDNWNTQVEELIPYGISRLCFFDAEQIRLLAEDETSTIALGSAIRSLLGLNLAERLIADATVLEGRLVKKASESSDLMGLEEAEEELISKQTEIDALVQKLGGLENSFEVAQNRLTLSEERYADIGGKFWENHQAYQKKLGELLQAFRDNESHLVTLAASELPLALLPNLLSDVRSQIELEQQVNENLTFSKLVQARDKRLLDELQRNRVDDELIELVDRFLSDDIDSRALDADITERLELPQSVYQILLHLLHRGLTDRVEQANQYLKQTDSAKLSLETIQRTLAATPKDDTVREAAVELKTATTDMAILRQQIEQLEKKLFTLRNSREEIKRRLTKLRQSIVETGIKCEEDTRLGALLIRTRETMNTFLQRVTDLRIEKLAELISESFRYLSRKKTLVNRIHVDPRTFEISIYDSDGKSVSKQRLSEGEKQILAISVLWGLSRASTRPLPVIIDTPMARLDAKHRDQLVERYFPHASHQVIVLSTDTEIDYKYFRSLQPHVSRAYHLNYDDHTKKTVAQEGYFWKEELAEKERTAE